MGRIKVISIGLLILGIGLSISGALFNYLEYPDIYYGIYSGPFLVVVALYILFKKQKSRIKGEFVNLSTRLTPVYKWVIPLLIIISLLIYTFISISNDRFFSFEMLPIGLLLLFSLPALLFSFKVKRVRVSFSKNVMLIRGYCREKEISISDVKELRRTSILLGGVVTIITNKNEKALFVPKISESDLNPVHEGKALTRLKSIINDT